MKFDLLACNGGPEEECVGSVHILKGRGCVAAVVRVPEEGYFTTTTFYSHGSVSVGRVADLIECELEWNLGWCPRMSRTPVEDPNHADIYVRSDTHSPTLFD